MLALLKPGRLVVAAVVLLLPLAGLALLLIRPGLDVAWEHHPSHFRLVLVTALVNLFLGGVAGEVAERKGDARVFLVSLVLPRVPCVARTPHELWLPSADALAELVGAMKTGQPLPPVVERLRAQGLGGDEITALERSPRRCGGWTISSTPMSARRSRSG